MKARVAALLISLLVSACATAPVRQPEALITGVEQVRLLGSAVAMIAKGEEGKARAALERVIKGPPNRGVSDEALFRLALLHLNDHTAGAARSQGLLTRLKAEFPRSVWTRQAAPLLAHLTAVRHLQQDRDRDKELKTLREQYQAILKENRELRQNMEKLQSLDLELEQKLRR